MKMRSLGQKVDILRALAHPVRIKILEELSKGVKCVKDFEKFLEIRQPNISQHLTLLRNLQIIDYYVDGKLRCYFLIDPLVKDMLEILSKDYAETLPRPQCCPFTQKIIGAHK
ncbi:Bacterial regulatory protein, ArsR domain protein [Candidatus Magnetoovum chiemensis]|nr:Bacterial regulatory protein, ArsR domain protein [Candidatus Magnetoovum chiemensis]